MRMGMPHLAFLTTKYPERFLHDEKSGETDEHGQALRTSVGHHGFKAIQAWTNPTKILRFSSTIIKCTPGS